MDSSDGPLADYVMKILLLQAAKCFNEADLDGLEWVNRTVEHLILRWETLRKK